MATEILSNSAKLADAFIEEIKVEVSVQQASPVKEDAAAVPTPDQQPEEAKTVEDVLQEVK